VQDQDLISILRTVCLRSRQLGGLYKPYFSYAPPSASLPPHQAADELGGDQLDGAGEKSLGEMVWELLGGRCGYGGGLGGEGQNLQRIMYQPDTAARHPLNYQNSDWRDDLTKAKYIVGFVVCFATVNSGAASAQLSPTQAWNACRGVQDVRPHNDAIDGPFRKTPDMYGRGRYPPPTGTEANRIWNSLKCYDKPGIYTH